MRQARSSIVSLWQNPSWFDRRQRQQQLDTCVEQTHQASFGLKRYQTEDKIQAVMAHFDRVAPRYDLMNSLLSFGIQHLWKRQAVRLLQLKPAERIIDVCGGTGDLSILAAQRVGPTGQVVIYDINRRMMERGRNTRHMAHVRRRLDYVQGDAECIAFPDAHFDVAMVGFGIRNLTHLEKGFREMVRVLKPGGRLLCLEFSRPSNHWFRALYDFYSFNIMPLAGLLLAGSAESYACLPETIRMFHLPDELSAILRRCGLEKVTYQPMTNAIAVAHVGHKLIQRH
jgi:demethylmenaquinone methyltransferase/2-methoxy-6-polyprenyl-1,4-benzoquinol methylase